ncbi:FG-GAP repeat domain-containing protein [Cyclobacterium xiamenense]|uniref:FG-GAP repeat domain-containing protein n=1 Tax=Cyclobacterium xiamenense TaxID=1297121 RepID=UPI0012BA14F2|nr:VCBS repeat-containing protein [Cyclobacterium xiamenense]
MKTGIRLSELVVLAFFPLAGLAQEEQGFADTTPWIRHTIDNTSLGSDGTKTADVNGDGKLDLAVGWEEGGVARLYLQPADPRQPWPYVEVPAPDVEDAFAADLDGDGQMDLITCSEGDHQRVTIHWAPADPEKYLDSKAWRSEDIPVTLGTTRWMFGRAVDVDGIHGLDLLVGSKDPNGTVGWLEAPVDPRNMEGWVYHEISPAGWIMSIEWVDMNGNGTPDVLITDRKGSLRGLRWFENPGASGVRGAWRPHLLGVRSGEPMFLGLEPDTGASPQAIVVADLLGGWTQFYRQGKQWLWEQQAYPEGLGTRGKSALLTDLDQDGKMDLVLSFEGALGKSGLAALMDFRSDSPGLLDISGAAGVKYDFVTAIDLDGDGDLDLVTSEETAADGSKKGLGVIWYENPLK